MANNIDCHPLFPAKSEDDEPPEVITIQVSRREGVSMVLIPRRFLADELTDETQISDLYGGGVYELVARNNSHITARRAVQLGGPSKPLYDAATMGAIPPPQASGLPAPMQHTANHTPPSWWIPLVTALAPLGLSWMNQRAESERRAQEQHQALMTTMMTNSQNANLQMVTLLTNLKGQSGGDGKEFREGMSFMENFIAGQIEREKEKSGGGEADDATETMKQLMQAMNMVQMFSGGPTPPVPTPEGGG